MLFTYIKKRTAREILSIVETNIQHLRNAQEKSGNNDALFMRCQFKINALTEVREAIRLNYRLNLKNKENG